MSRRHLIVFGVVIGLAAWFLYWLVGVFQVSPDMSAWERPAYQDGRWLLSGVAEEMIQKEMFGVQIDLLRVRYSKGDVWAAAGAERSDGLYESFVEGFAAREQVREAFTFPRWVILSVKGEPGIAGAGDCPNPSSPRCHLTRLAEQNVPVLLDGDEQYTESTSTIFVRTGVFPGHYLYGFLTWDIALGQIIKPGMEGN